MVLLFLEFYNSGTNGMDIEFSFVEIGIFHLMIKSAQSVPSQVIISFVYPPPEQATMARPVPPSSGRNTVSVAVPSVETGHSKLLADIVADASRSSVEIVNNFFISFFFKVFETPFVFYLIAIKAIGQHHELADEGNGPCESPTAEYVCEEALGHREDGTAENTHHEYA